MKKGVVFNHKAHQALAGDCKKCHEKAPGKIEGVADREPLIRENPSDPRNRRMSILLMR